MIWKDHPEKVTASQQNPFQIHLPHLHIYLNYTWHKIKLFHSVVFIWFPNVVAVFCTSMANIFHAFISLYIFSLILEGLSSFIFLMYHNDGVWTVASILKWIHHFIRTNTSVLIKTTSCLRENLHVSFFFAHFAMLVLGAGLVTFYTNLLSYQLSCLLGDVSNLPNLNFNETCWICVLKMFISFQSKFSTRMTKALWLLLLFVQLCKIWRNYLSPQEYNCILCVFKLHYILGLPPPLPLRFASIISVIPLKTCKYLWLRSSK